MSATLLLLWSVLSWGAGGAEAEPTSAAPRFAPPVRLKAENQFLAAKRHYPSPVMHDVNGDGRLDMVIGDLFGALTVNLRTEDGWAKKAVMKGADGQPLDFHNW